MRAFFLCAGVEGYELRVPFFIGALGHCRRQCLVAPPA